MFFIKLKSFIRDYFTLTSRERKGALMLAVIILIQIVIIIRLHYLAPPVEPVITTHRLQLDAFDKKSTVSNTKKAMYATGKSPVFKTIPVLTPFNPNTISDNEWMKLGLSQKQTMVVRNYLNKGGRFRNKESLSKMYCISPEHYQQLEPWIRIPKEENPLITETNKLPPPVKNILRVELNTADTIQLMELPLVGSGRARLIYKYRERLGGFLTEKQLLEVFTIDSTVLQAIQPYIQIDTHKIRKLNMNSDSLYHPYLNRKAAAAIIAYRKQHGNFIDINGLRKVAVLDEQMWHKVAPYAVFE